MHEQVGKMIRYYRKKQGLTLIGLAEKAGVGKTAIFDIEHGRAAVKLPTLIKILKTLDIRLLFRTPTADVEFKEKDTEELV